MDLSNLGTEITDSTDVQFRHISLMSTILRTKIADFISNVVATELIFDSSQHFNSPSTWNR